MTTEEQKPGDLLVKSFTDLGGGRNEFVFRRIGEPPDRKLILTEAEIAARVSDAVMETDLKLAVGTKKLIEIKSLSGPI